METVHFTVGCKVKYYKKQSLNLNLYSRHPMERFESLYANKFSGVKWENIAESLKHDPKSPFLFITRNIVIHRKKDPGPQFNSSLTPNELVE